jgi:hypothetical protein
MCLPGTDRAESSSGRKGPCVPFPRCQDRATTRVIPGGRLAGPHKSWLACVGPGDQARAPAQKNAEAPSLRQQHGMGETGILSSRTTSRDQLPLFPDTRMLEQVEAPNEVDNRVTGLSRARSGKAASYSRRPVVPRLLGSYFPVRRPQNTRVGPAWTNCCSIPKLYQLRSCGPHATNLSCQGDEALGSIAGAAERQRSVTKFDGFQNKAPAGGINPGFSRSSSR